MSRRWDADGTACPLGVSYVVNDDAFNFAIYSKHAEKVTLLLYGRGEVRTPLKVIELELPRNRTGRIWHCRALG